jgi:ERCC4-type nuclease
MQGNLLIDIHQEKHIQAGLLAAYPGCSQLKLLTTGDYAWQSDSGLSIGIESKTASNLIMSFTTGQLADQCKRMLEDYDVAILLISGRITRDNSSKVLVESDVDSPAPTMLFKPYTRIHRKHLSINTYHSALNNFLMSVQAAGMLIDYSTSLEPRYNLEIARVIELIKYFDKPEHTAIKRRKYYSPFQTDPRENKLSILRSLPGVNDKLAANLLQYFGSVAKIFSASEEELAQVPGIGKIKASNIYQVITSTAS